MPDRADPDAGAAVWHQDDVLDLLPFIRLRGGVELDPTQYLAQHDAHLHHRESRTEATAIAAAERQPVVGLKRGAAVSPMGTSIRATYLLRDC